MDDVETQSALEPDEAAQAAPARDPAGERMRGRYRGNPERGVAGRRCGSLDGLAQRSRDRNSGQPILDSGSEIVSLMPRETAADLLHGVSADRVADLCRKLEEP